jgi:hypothetical protein
VAHLVPGVTWWLVPLPLMALSVFVSVVQNCLIILLSQLYLSEVSHAPDDHEHEESVVLIAAVLAERSLFRGFIDHRGTEAQRHRDFIRLYPNSAR